MDISEINGGTLLIIKKEDLQDFAECLAKKILIIKTDSPKKSDTEKPISQPEAIEFLGKSRQTLITWRKKGLITAHMLGGRVYYLKSELLEAMKI